MRNQPNVLVFFTDQQRFDASGLHGNPLGLMPNFDRLATANTHLFNTFTPQPVCGPARSCLQTGQYATTTGCWRNGIKLSPDSRTLAHHFNDAGYDTAYFGKWHLADKSTQGPVVPEERGGYQFWLAANTVEMTSREYDAMLYDGDGQPVKLPGYRVDAFTDAVIRYLAQPREKPYFAFVSFLEPHQQNHRDNYPAPVGYEERYRGRWTPPDLQELGGSSARQLGGYWGMVKRLDEAFGRVLDALRSLGQLENTIVVFTSDHGCHFKTRNDEYKRTCHESSIRVPTLLAGPGFEGGGQRRELVSLVDLPPTLLDACGIEVPDAMQGRSLMPLLRGQSRDWQNEAFVQISESHNGRVLRTQRWKYSVGAPNAPGMWDTSEPVTPPVYDEQFLYDLHADPYELDNLVGFESHRALADELKTRLLAKITEIEGQNPEIRNAPPRSRGQRIAPEVVI